MRPPHAPWPSLWPFGLAVSVLLTVGTAWGQTEWTKYPGNPVLPLGAQGEWDSGVASVPVVLFDGTTYRLWYSGGHFTLEDIGLATSPGGVTWTKHPGNPVLRRDGAGAWDAASTWPVAIVYDGAVFHLWYNALAYLSQQVEQTGYATSLDGITWTKYWGNPILPAGAPGTWDDGGATFGSVLLEGGTYRGWYIGGPTDGSVLAIGYATSSDGANWDKWPEPVLEPRPSEWDQGLMAGPVLFDGSAYHMWYTGFGAAVQIGHAVSLDGMHWTRQPAAEPVLAPGGAGAFDAGGVAFPAVLLVGDTAQMWFSGAPLTGGWRLGYATAPLPFPEPPVAAFTWSPTSPSVGQTVAFTDQSTEDPTSWVWDFGDSATSTEQHPTHAYAAAGAYTVSLTASNASGPSTPVTHEITVTPPSTLDEFYFVAAAGNAGGAGGSQWVTDVEINNPDDDAMQYRFMWLPRDQDNSTPTQSDVFTLGGGTSVRYLNVLDSVFSQTGFGALAIVAHRMDAIVMSRTFNQSATGTFGQSIPGLYSASLIPANQRARIVFMTENDAYRSNLGLLNGTGAAIDVQVALYDADGNALGATQTTTLAPWSNTQLNRPFHSYMPVAVGYVDVWTETEGGAFAAYGSIIDNATGDPTTVMPADVNAVKRFAVDQLNFVAAAGNAGGAGGSQWVTDIEINNPDMTALSYRFLWLPRDQDNSNPTQSDLFTLNPGKSTRYSNVLSTVFSQTGFGALAVLADSSAEIVMSRTFNESATGTFGQSIEGLAAGRLIPVNTRMRIVFMTENDAYRSNLGLLNGTGAAIDVQIALYDADGNALGATQTKTLAPWSNTQLNRPFQSYLPVAVGYVDVWTETAGGAFAAYGSIIDNATGDPTTVMPQ